MYHKNTQTAFDVRRPQSVQILDLLKMWNRARKPLVMLYIYIYICYR